ncbi:aerolysin [Cohnella xylanilytica]|uniref:S8 family peptidase n=1 Tax=Cohnella xylanilytica TaxID=557555 RepID=UPI001B04CA55|nr:S8 family peptidase [Cohnella xylanilytica]GIO11758.1 aerolysin [Cohnella xylanilytica]
MNSVEQLLCRSVRAKPSRSAERRIVAFRDPADYRSCLRRLAAMGVKPVKTSSALRLICVRANKKHDWGKLRSHPKVAYAEKDAKVTAHGLPDTKRKVRVRRSSAKADCPPKAPWNVCRVQSPPVWTRTRGAGVKIGIIDTGIARHPDLRIAGGVNTIGGTSFADDNGHGTHVAGIAAATGRGRIFGNAPQAGLYAIKALDSSGSGFVSDIVEGIDWCIANGIRVINMSFGMPGDSQALRAAVRLARRRGIVLVASAGNEGRQSGGVIDAPARYPETLAVAATTRGDRVASFSSRGRGIDLAAPGVNILSTWPGGRYVRLSGTSMSAPHVTGGSALLRALSPRLGASAVGSRLRANARRIPGGRMAVGSGLLQVAPAAAGLGVRGRAGARTACACAGGTACSCACGSARAAKQAAAARARKAVSRGRVWRASVVAKSRKG